ncbi:hypothetical protein FRC12_009679 [Ceratobasidium sp. 428]|nr:hypothetical protein FRC12_009679 [Ceratobasidium sp. 428]
MQNQVPLLTTGDQQFPYSPGGYYGHAPSPDGSYFGSGSGRVARRYEPYGGGGPGSSTSSTASSKRARSRRGTGSKGYGNSGSTSPEGAGYSASAGSDSIGYAPQYQGYTYGGASGSYAPSSPGGGRYAQGYSNAGPPPPPSQSMTPVPQYGSNGGYQDGNYAPASTYYGHPSTPAPAPAAPSEDNYHSGPSYGTYAGYTSSNPVGGDWVGRRDSGPAPVGYSHPGATWGTEIHGS